MYMIEVVMYPLLVTPVDIPFELSLGLFISPESKDVVYSVVKTCLELYLFP